jgi:hypothetical protein
MRAASPDGVGVAAGAELEHGHGRLTAGSLGGVSSGLAMRPRRMRDGLTPFLWTVAFALVVVVATLLVLL